MYPSLAINSSAGGTVPQTRVAQYMLPQRVRSALDSNSTRGSRVATVTSVGRGWRNDARTVLQLSPQLRTCSGVADRLTLSADCVAKVPAGPPIHRCSAYT
jgi:hypothetical protein